MIAHLMTRRTAFAGMAMLVVICLTSVSGRGAEASYFENFDNCPNGRPVNFVESSDSNWIVYAGSVPGTAYYQGGLYVAGGWGVISSAIPLANAPGQDFTVSANVSVFGHSAADSRKMDLGLVVLGSNPDFTASGYRLSFYVYGAYDVLGKLFLQRAEAPGGGTYSSFYGPYDGVHRYTMTLSGKYLNESLILTGTLNDGLRTVSVTMTDNAPLIGTNFGFRQEVGASSLHPGGFTADWDDFSVMLHDSPGGDLNQDRHLAKAGK